MRPFVLGSPLLRHRAARRALPATLTIGLALAGAALPAQTTASGDKAAAPVIISAANVSGKVGELFSHRVATNGVKATFRARNLPPELSINLATGVISGVPVSARPFTIIVEAQTETATHSQEIKVEVVREAPKS